MKTTLTLDVDYDPTMTDPERLSSAMDTLLETALSTPGILDECGEVQVGTFLVAEREPEPAAAQQVRPDLPTGGAEVYALRIGGDLLRNQRRLLLRLIEAASPDSTPMTDEDKDILEGVTALLDEIADQAHDRYGMDCLLE